MTYDQKFILLLKTDKFFKDECRYMQEEWELPHNEAILSAEESELPIQYKKDIRFILFQSVLPNRFFSPLHQYLLTNKIPSLKELPPRAGVFWRHNPSTEMGKIIIEIDIDAAKKDIEAVVKDVTYLKKLMQKVNQSDKISQPVKKFNETLKIALNPNTIHEIAERGWVEFNAEITRKKGVATKSRLRAKLSRTKKALSSKRRISVRQREEVEKFMKNIKTDW